STANSSGPHRDFSIRFSCACMALNAANATLTSEPEYPFHTAVLTACYLVGALQIGFYGFYILFMGMDSVFNASRAFDYEDFDCQRKAVPQGSEELENNANSRRVGPDEATVATTASATATATASATANEEAYDNNSNYGGKKVVEDELVQQQDETDVGDGDGGAGSSSSSRRHVGRASSRRLGRSSGGNAAMAVRGGRGFATRGPLYRLMQSCSCMLVYKSDDEEDEEDDDGSGCGFEDQEETDDESSSYDSDSDSCSDNGSSGQGSKDRADGDATATAAAVATPATAASAAPCPSGGHISIEKGPIFERRPVPSDIQMVGRLGISTSAAATAELLSPREKVKLANSK
ncbi:hypothetical protein BOX15_Mlig011554g3, partial [Macrostomum lignano]